MIEEYRELPNFSKYLISNYGNIKSKYMKTYMNLQEVEKGYLRVTLNTDDGKKKSFLVHRLISEVFIPNPDNKFYVNHKDGNKANNRIDNLEWVTDLENKRHSVVNGLNAKGEKIHSAKLKSNQVENIKALLKDGLSGYMIAKKFNVCKDTIYSIKKGKTWKHI